MEFYNVKKRAKVKIAEAKCEKVVYEIKQKKSGKIQKRYAAKAIDDDGTSLTRFLTKDAYDALKCKVGKK